MGSDETSFFRRYGDVYPPADLRGEGYEAVLDVDDVLYFYWYRRWEFFGPSPEGPIKEPPRQTSSRDGTGLRLYKGQSETLSGVSVRLSLVEDRAATLAAFPQEKPPSGHEFLLLTISFRPVGHLPRTIAKANQPQNLIVAESAKPSAMTAHGAHFNILDGEASGFYLAPGATFAFTEAGQQEQRTFVFIVPKQRTNDKYRVNVHSTPPVAPAPAGAKMQEAKPPAPKAAPPAPVAPAPVRVPGT